ncbi:hypothetical protein ACVWYN_002899 [Pedobacter sp. UYP24]
MITPYYKRDLNFNSYAYNYWPIYDTVKKYYPIGIKRLENSVYFDYPGLKELDNIVVEAIHGEDNKKFKAWQAFMEQLSSKFQVKHMGTTMGQAPSNSAEFILEDVDTPEFRRVKKLVLAVSLAGKFFAIFGIDETFIKEKAEKTFQWQYHAINVVTISPYGEFETLFNGIKIAVEQQFEGYKFVPFMVHCAVIEGLQVRYSDREECTIFHALFNDQYKLKDGMVLRGELSFGSKDWETENAELFKIEVRIAPPPPIS